MPIARRLLLPALALPFVARAQPHHGGGFSTLRGEPVPALSEPQIAQRRTGSPAPPGPPGQWQARAPLPIPRSEMAWATALGGRMHLVAGYGEGRVDRSYHHVYDPAADAWSTAAPLPRGANHVAVVAEGPLLYALGGFTLQNRGADDSCFVWDSRTDRWRAIASLPRPRGAGSAVALGGRIHLIGGAGDPDDERASVAWHEVYLPAVDKWERRRPIPAGRDHAGAVPWQDAIHVIGGRFNTFQDNTSLHHVYDAARDQWERRAPMPTARSGHGLAIVGGRFYAMGGEGREISGGAATDSVYGQVESYEPATDTWQSHAPMPTPRHGLGAAAIEGTIYVAGGGPVVGGGIQSSLHEAFTPAAG